MVKIELTPELCNNLRILVMAGAKSPQTGEDALMAGAHLLQIIAQAQAEAGKPKPNGHDEQASTPPA